MKKDVHAAPSQSVDETRERLPWTSPMVQDLPKLSELTLLTGGPIGGGGDTGGGGSTVF